MLVCVFVCVVCFSCFDWYGCYHYYYVLVAYRCRVGPCGAPGQSRSSASAAACAAVQLSGLCYVSAFVAWRLLRSRGARSMPSAYRQSRCAAGRHRSRVGASGNQCRCAFLRVSSGIGCGHRLGQRVECGSAWVGVNGASRAGRELREVRVGARCVSPWPAPCAWRVPRPCLPSW